MAGPVHGKHKRHGCRKQLEGDFEGGSTLEHEHESKSAKVHVYRIVMRKCCGYTYTSIEFHCAS